MNTRPLPAAMRRRERGVALVITLFFLIIITVMTLGLIDSSRVERSAANSHFDRLRAGTFAREGVEITQAILQRETVDPPKQPGETNEAYDKRKRNWISQPGALIVPADPSASIPVPDLKQIRKEVTLSSGAPSADWKSFDPIFHPAPLNVQTLVEQTPSTYLISDRADPKTMLVPEMRVRWVYVRKDGTYELPDPTRPIANAQPAPYSVPANLPIEQPNLTDTSNPIVGRFAYWVDDESSKVNYNLAWKRDVTDTTPANSNKTAFAHPSRISLMGLTLADGTQMTEPMADALHNWITKTPARYFNSFADARQVSADIAQMLDFNRFELTHYNHDPDTTFFGEDRIMLTTNRSLVPRNPDGTYARKFLDILRDDIPVAQQDPGILEHIAGGQPDYSRSGFPVLPNKFDAAVRTLMNYISTKAWPLSPGVSFKDKYYPGTPDTDARLGQIAVNIIDYIRAKESPQAVVAPLRFALSSGGLFTIHPSVAYGAANSYQGISRAPYITEMGVYVEKDPVAPPAPISGITQVYRAHFKMELYLPPNYGFQHQGIDLVPDLNNRPTVGAPPPLGNGSMGWYSSWTETRDPKKSRYWFQSPHGQMVLMESHSTNAVRIFNSDITGGEGPNGTVLNEGKRVVVTKIFYRNNPWAAHNVLGIRGVLYRGTPGSDGLLLGELNRWPRVNIGTQTGDVSYSISNPATTTIDRMVSIETDDPRCNVHTSDWQRNLSGINTFGAENSRSTIGKAPTKSPIGSPQQDTDGAGRISTHSFYMPPPKGTGTNGPGFDNGQMTSIGELGYIHTGNNAKTGSTPWRSIRLQPNNYPAANVLPDWAFMDLFTVPNTGAQGSDQLYKPHGTAIGGRVNVNSHIEPFDDKLMRDRGLVALLTDCKSLPTPAAAATIADHIYHRRLADGTNRGKIYGYPWRPNPAPTDPNAFDTPGEICEIKGVADRGEESEDLIREISSLITSRGGVFTVYTVGQALKQTPNGKLIVTAEQRQQAMIERFLDNKGTTDAGDDETRFRTIYFRNLTP